MDQVIPTLTRIAGDILSFLNSVPAEYYSVILLALPFSAIVAFTKTFAQRHWDVVPSETKMFLTNFAGLILLSVGAYLNSTPTTDPFVAIASLVGITTAVQQPFFFRFVKPFVKNFWVQWDNSKSLNADLSSAAIPEGGLPIEQR